MAVKTYGLTHMAITVKDPGRSAQFYADAFGAWITHRSDDGGASSIEINTPGSHDVIVLERGTPPKGNAKGVTHFGFRLTDPGDIDAAAEALEAAGASIDERGEFVPGQPYVFARDPDGYVVEVWFEPLRTTP